MIGTTENLTIVIDKLIESDRNLPKRILVIGDGMTDVYINGKLDVSCQEGCPKFIEKYRVVVPGGAANAARSLKNWFANTKFAFQGCLGPIKTRFMVDNKCIFRHDDDECHFDMNLARIMALEMLKSGWAEGVLISDYDKGVMTPKFISDVIRICKEQNIPCVADCKREPSVYQGAILKGNGYYFKQYAEKARTMHSQCITTYGPYSPLIWDCGQPASNFDNYSVNCINHVGAGDCFAAHLTLALIYGLSLKESAAVAHSAGRVYVQRSYNTPPRIEDIKWDMDGKGPIKVD